ncbi:MAG: universal stress protein [Methanobacterium sp.]
MYSKILIPIDGSIHSNNASRHAIWIACQMNAEIIVLNVIEDYYLESTAQEVLISQMEENISDNAKDSVNRVYDILTEMKIEGKCKKDIVIDTEIREGNPSNEILRMADEENIDLIVMGKTGRKGRRKSKVFEGINQFLMGSTASKVIRKAPCPVLTVLNYF